MKLDSIAVFCGSSKGVDPEHAEKARALGKFLADRDIELVYGAGNIGLMGEIADGALEAGGRVVGVIPHFIKEKEVCHTELTELFTVDSMHARKRIMAERADGFIILPGGYGTLDEFFEILTWKQLQLHQKPIGLLNWNKYYDHLLVHFRHMVQEGFLKVANLELLVIEETVEALLLAMQQAPGNTETKWIERS